MSDVEKIIQKMKNKPNGIRFQEIKRVLENHGYLMKLPKRNVTSAFYK